MTRSLTEVEWDDITEAAPAVITAIAMPFTFSIAEGIAFGFISYAGIKLGDGPLSATSIRPSEFSLCCS